MTLTISQRNTNATTPTPRYLSHYAQTGEARILNSERAVVGLTKGHAVFPVSLSVVKLSGTGDDAIFLGLLRVERSEDASLVRVWVAPGSGLILTADESFADGFGVAAGELVGRGLSSLGPDIEKLDRCVLCVCLHACVCVVRHFGVWLMCQLLDMCTGLLQDWPPSLLFKRTLVSTPCRLVAEATALPPEEATNNTIKCRTQLLHRCEGGCCGPFLLSVACESGRLPSESCSVLTVLRK